MPFSCAPPKKSEISQLATMLLFLKLATAKAGILLCLQIAFGGSGGGSNFGPLARWQATNTRVLQCQVKRRPWKLEDVGVFVPVCDIDLGPMYLCHCFCHVLHRFKKNIPWF